MREYKGYFARVCWYKDDNLYFGQLSGISDLVVFHGETAADIETQFHAAVDEDLEFCHEIGKTPNRPNNEDCCMTGIKINGMVYWYSDDAVPKIQDYLDMNADVVYEEKYRPIDMPDSYTEIHINGIVYAFASIDEYLDELDHRAEKVEEDK